MRFNFKMASCSNTMTVVNSINESKNEKIRINGEELNDREKCQLIQKQLNLLLHAQKCLKSSYWQCTMPNCGMIKEVLVHMGVCQAGKNCNKPHCVTSRQIMTHWKNCTFPTCTVCGSLKANT